MVQGLPDVKYQAVISKSHALAYPARYGPSAERMASTFPKVLSQLRALTPTWHSWAQLFNASQEHCSGYSHELQGKNYELSLVYKKKKKLGAGEEKSRPNLSIYEQIEGM